MTLTPENFDKLPVIKLVAKSYKHQARFHIPWTQGGIEGWVDLDYIRLDFKLLDWLDEVNVQKVVSFYTRNSPALYQDKSWVQLTGVDLGDGRVMVLMGNTDTPVILRPDQGRFLKEKIV